MQAWISRNLLSSSFHSETMEETLMTIVDTDALSVLTFLCDMQKTKAKEGLCLHTFITFIISFECLNKLFLPAWQFLQKVLFISVLQYSQNNNSINRCHSEQSFGHTAMFIHKFFSGALCRIVPFSHKNNSCIWWKSTNVMYYIISLVVYIYYKCTIWLQYKDSFK